ncbi:helix-turn-helix domain-containing protein [Bacillus sp. Au-Bac7]|uniref:helix-turn-helix domain-containing protein n=1 Tax=Bacillus sp. Au-Bac7 TaxID=2906458 RepID=UPI001E2983AF|nr:helix-turn-helix transcriptional regulator [Bacillus sp. Au-Bac7]MCE4051872.1 helix-turn-helix transcriptional regulator [Bacillus sp. Au-Bac7]
MKKHGLGKERSKLGRYIDRNSINQSELEKAGVSKGTVSRLCSSNKNQPNLKTAKKIINFLKKYDKSIDYKDFFDL